jgi:hypothetical protein
MALRSPAQLLRTRSAPGDAQGQPLHMELISIEIPRIGP